jgi:glycosyltransferase involved in cell wall biosynthesis
MHVLEGRVSVAPARSRTAGPRLFLDISTLLRWVGPPVGIMRVEAELTRYVMERRPDIGFIAYDSRVHDYRPVKRAMVPQLIAGDLFVDFTGAPDPRSVPRRGLSERLSRWDQHLLYVRRPRRAGILTLEWLRTKVAPSQRRHVESVQSLLLNDRYRRMFFDPQGRRRSMVEYASLLEDRPPALRGATILAPGSEWNTKNPDRLLEVKQREGFRLIMVCYDLIPILFPQFYQQRDHDVFDNYFRKAIGFVDKFVCISGCTARDIEAFAAKHGQHVSTSVQPLASELLQARDAELPTSLQRGRYALYVSTIEPRKNHELLHRVWHRLLARGVPQKRDFQLVFVGRPGWNTDALMRQLDDDAASGRHFHYLSHVDDSLLNRLYRDAAFCLYPSLYEGYGLPVVEAFAHGRAVIASNAGSLPEVVEDMSPSLPPDDDDAWYRTLCQWIEEPALVAAYEAKIANGFTRRSWSEVAGQYLAEAEAEMAAV